MKNINIFTTIMFLMILSVINSFSQCVFDDANPQITAVNFDIECVALNESTTLTVDWAMIASGASAIAPVGSWQILVSMDQTMTYTSINGVADVNGPEFDWTWDPGNNTFRGTNNIPIVYDFDALILPQGKVEITVTGVIDNECNRLQSIANIVIVPSFLGGCPAAFQNQIADDNRFSKLGVSPLNSISGFVFHDYFADGTQGNLTGTGTDDAIGGIPVTLKDCGPNNSCGDVDDGPTMMTTTIADGTYIFDKLAYGNYKVCFGMDDGTTAYDEFTMMNTSGSNAIDDSDVTAGSAGGATGGITLDIARRDVTDVDAGLFEYATISGTLFEDNDGTNGTTVAASVNDIIIVKYCDNPTACDMTSTVEYLVTTDANGDYTITDVIPGVILSINSTNYSTFKESTVINDQTLDAHSGGSITDQNFALPVTMLYFTASKDQDNSLLEWATSQEINNDYFEVQHSLDGLVFSEIGIVKGNGSVNTITKYNFVHREPSNVINYYRLKQYDFDGRYNYSEIRALKFESVGLLKLNVFPVPTYSNVTLEVSKELSGHKIILLDKLGRLINTYEFSNQMKIQLSDYSYGVYFIKLIDSGGNTVEQQKLIYVK